MVVIVLNGFQRPFEPFNHFKKRVPSKSKSEFREIDFDIFMEQLEDVLTSLVSSNEIFASNLYLLLIICSHWSFFLSSANQSSRRHVSLMHRGPLPYPHA